jgi:hypothetical protein
MDIQPVVNDLLLAGTVGAAVWLSLLTRKLVKQAVLARYDQYRPVIVPIMKGGELLFTITSARDRDDHEYPFANLQGTGFATLANIGPGPALGVQGVIFGPAPREGFSEYAGHQFFTFGMPIKGDGLQHEAPAKEGVIEVSGNDRLGGPEGPTLYAPVRLPIGLHSEPVMVARMSITYHDIFGRKHASTFDVTELGEFQAVGDGFLEAIKKDLTDLDREGRARLQESMRQAVRRVEAGDIQLQMRA